MVKSVKMGVALPTPWTTQLEEVTPERARELLGGNVGNRPPSSHTMKLYGAVMSASKWLATPESVMLSPEGRLLNGQHRLMEVVATGCTQKLSISYNVPEELYPVLDRGKRRTLENNHGLKAGAFDVARLLLDVIGVQHAPDHLVVATHERVRDDFDYLMLDAKKKLKTFGSTPIRAAAIMQMFGATPDVKKRIKDSYFGMTTSRLELLTPIAQHFVGLIATGKIKASQSRAGRRELLIHAWQVFSATQRKKLDLKNKAPWPQQVVARASAICDRAPDAVRCN